MTMPAKHKPAELPVWLYDGVCVLCSGAVRYTLKYERDHDIRFVAVQSDTGRKLARLHNIDPDAPQSFLFVENGQALAKSDAVFALVEHLNGPARLLLLGRILPVSVRDWLYDRVARNRYRLFGRTASCKLPDPAQRHRFNVPDA